MRIRLDKFISDRLCVTRSEAKNLIKSGRTEVDGICVRTADTHINTDENKVVCMGKTLSGSEFVYIMMNKPAGIVCAVRDSLSPTVTELIPSDLRRKGLFPAGRLDKDTEGFVFITNDGQTAHRMLSPSSHVRKEYIAVLEKPAENHYAARFAEGMEIDGGEICLPAKLDFTENKYTVRIVLYEGKYHQVKRMISAVGNKVISLRRTAIGGITLDPGLPPGGCREILHKELQNLYAK